MCLYRGPKRMTNSLFLHHEGQMRLYCKGRGEFFPEAHSPAMASPQRQRLNMSHKCCECANSRLVKSDGCGQDVQSMLVYSTCVVSPFKSCSLGVCSAESSCTPFLFRHKPRVNSFKENDATGSVSVTLVRLFPSFAPLCTQKNLAGEVSIPSFKANHSMSTRWTLLAFRSNHCMLHLSYRPLLSVTHAPRTSRATSPGDFSRAALPNISDT